MHGQHHDGAKQDEQGISALFECVHVNSWGKMVNKGAFSAAKTACTKIKQKAHRASTANRQTVLPSLQIPNGARVIYSSTAPICHRLRAL
jgi:hypothetical protein